MTYLLDINAVIAVLHDRPAEVRRRLRRALRRGGAISVSSVVVYELWYGIAHSQRFRENGERIRAFLSGNITIRAFDDQDAAVAGRLRAELEAVGAPIGPYDLLIAAQALRGNATLVTANASEFARVRGLTWQDWTKMA